MARTASKGFILVGLAAFAAGTLFSGRGSIEAQPATGSGPKWSHAYDLRTRKSGEAEFNAKTQKYGVEVFEDTKNNNLIYISETGSISVVPKRP